ncbi:MAG: hypothetical protein IJ083_10845, partial [Clostridia bacterium]|nr:hypothetical protein [Clostridia bacterium]
PDSLQEIGEEAFVGLKDLVIFIPSTVTYIADKAFGNNLIPCCEENSYAWRRCKELELWPIAMEEWMNTHH